MDDVKRKAVIVSGYFNPIHKGHLEYFIMAKSFGDKLFVIVNNDHQRELKGSKPFQDQDERKFLVSNLKPVDHVIIALDKDRTVVKSIEAIVREFGESHTFAFANGGDQVNDSIPEREVCEELGVDLIDGLGAKIQSSSWLLK